MESVSPICLFTCCRLEYIKLGSPSDLMWSEFPQTLTQMQGARRYVTLFESPFVDSSLSEKENNALRASSLLVVPPPPPEVQPLEGLQGTNLPEANLTQWAYVQDVASGMRRPPHCPHLQGLPVPPGPMEHPSALQQPQRPNRPGAMGSGAYGSSRVGRPMTSESSGGSSWMEGGAGDGSFWFEWVTRAEAGPGACKRKKTDVEQQAPGCPFPLISEEARKEAMGVIYKHVAGREPSQKNIASRAISAYYPDFTLATVKAVVSQVLCMIAEYHLACATMGSTTTSPILPKAVKQYLPPLVDYAHPGGTGLTDV